jgi:hypothetical protein
MIRPWWDAQLIVLGREKMLAASYLDDQLANFDFDVLCLIDVEVLRGLLDGLKMAFARRCCGRNSASMA